MSVFGVRSHVRSNDELPTSLEIVAGPIASSIRLHWSDA
jgi:hypothetical protein